MLCNDLLTLNVSRHKIAPLWGILKPLAPAGAVSNAHLAINGHASNPSRNFATNMASPSPATTLTKPVVVARLVTENIIIVLVLTATFGKTELAKVVNQIIQPVPSELYFIRIIPVLMNLYHPKHYLVLLFMKKPHLQTVG